MYDTEECTGAERGSRGGPGASTAAEREASTICPLSLVKNYKKNLIWFLSRVIFRNVFNKGSVPVFLLGI